MESGRGEPTTQKSYPILINSIRKIDQSVLTLISTIMIRRPLELLQSIVPHHSVNIYGFWGLSRLAWEKVLEEANLETMDRLVQTYPVYQEMNSAIWEIVMDGKTPQLDLVQHLHNLIPLDLEDGWGSSLLWATNSGRQILQWYLQLPLPDYTRLGAKLAAEGATPQCRELLEQWCPVLRHDMTEPYNSSRAPELLGWLQNDQLERVVNWMETEEEREIATVMESWRKAVIMGSLPVPPWQEDLGLLHREGLF